MSKPVILGAGLAGLTTALALAPMPCLLVSPRILGRGCSSDWAQGGIAAAVGPDDTAALHAADTLAAGAGFNDAAIVDQTTGDGASVIEKLTLRGVAFDRDELGHLRLGLEAAHRKRRIVHARDATGHAVMQALIAGVRAMPSIEVIENAVAEILITDDQGIASVALRHEDQQTTVLTDRVVLATGGAAALWRDTTNPHENWGSGLVLAARAGAALGDLEFMQFHPTAIDCGRDPMPLASEALRGEGATLVDESGARFTDELQPRDIVTRAIWQQIGFGHRIFLDARPLKETFVKRFPSIYALCRAAGIDPTQSPIPVRPAAHYHMGGVVTDARGRTDVDGLWACGEAACTGLHGANRLASNSLLEAASFGQRVADDIKGFTTRGVKAAPFPTPSSFKLEDKNLAAQIRATMSDKVGVIRTRSALSQAIDFLSPHAEQSAMAATGLMIALSAFKREESRGGHFRSDFPQASPTGRRATLHLSDLEIDLGRVLN